MNTETTVRVRIDTGYIKVPLKMEQLFTYQGDTSEKKLDFLYVVQALPIFNFIPELCNVY